MTPTQAEIRRLAEWEPPLGVVSVYLRIDPADRGAGWRTELRNGLAKLRDEADGLGHDARLALRATAERISERFVNHERDLPRGEIGFVEVAERPAEEHWWSSHLPPAAAPTASRGARALVAPLLHVARRESCRGVVLVSSERVRLVEWRPGHLEELHDWELSVFMDEWRERKAQRVADPTRSQAVSASGHDRFDDRLRENRHRFLGECGRLAGAAAGERGWERLLLLGSPEHRRDLEHGVAVSGLELEHGGDADLISEPAGRIEEEIEAAAEALELERGLGLVERALGETAGGVRGSAGHQETEAALAEGRVATLLFDLARAPECEGLARRALETGADVLAVGDEAAERLGDVDGVAALLRY